MPPRERHHPAANRLPTPVATPRPPPAVALALPVSLQAHAPLENLNRSCLIDEKAAPAAVARTFRRLPLGRALRISGLVSVTVPLSAKKTR